VRDIDVRSDKGPESIMYRYRSCYENEWSQHDGAIIEKSGSSHYIW